MARDEEKDARDTAAAEARARLRSRGVALTGAERPEELGDMLDAVERFEAAVEAHGGDLMVDDLKSVKPDDSHFVLPRRNKNEIARDYIGRITAAMSKLRDHPRKPD